MISRDKFSVFSIFFFFFFFLPKNIQVINVVNEPNIEEIKNLIIKLQTLLKKFDGAPGIFIYLERVKNIAREKYKDMQSHNEKQVVR